MVEPIRIKRRGSGAAGAPSSLLNAELAFNEVDSTLYYGFGTGGAGGTATTMLAIAGPGAFTTIATTQTISGNKTFTGIADFTSATITVPTQTLTDNSTKAASTAFIKGQNYLTGNQSITFSGDATGSGTTNVSLTLASVVTAGTSPKVTFNAKGLITGFASLIASDIPTLTAAKISDFDTQVRLSRLDQLAAPTTSVAFNAQRITGVADPTAAQDATTKAYVDAIAQGLDPKASCRALATTNITLSGTQTIDGVSVVAGDRVLVAGQTTGSQNGIYVVASGAWTRAIDADSSTKLTPGAYVFIEQGTTYADTPWTLVTDAPITLGTTALTFSQFNGAGSISAGAGLTKTGNTLDAVGTLNRILVNADSIDISSSYVGQTSITTLGTIATGTWNGNLISLVYGGTGTDLSAIADGTILKKSGTGLVAAVSGTDYLAPGATIDGGTF